MLKHVPFSKAGSNLVKSIQPWQEKGKTKREGSKGEGKGEKEREGRGGGPVQPKVGDAMT